MVKLAIAPLHNSAGKHDATGAFQPEARAFCALHRAPAPFLFDQSGPLAPRFRQVQRWLALQQRGSVEALAVFSHGFKSGLQIGVSVDGNIAAFAHALSVACVRAPVIALYCCDAARDDDDDSDDDKLPGPGGTGGFADKLRSELDKRGLQATIYAHASTGHTTWNPFVRRFDSGEIAGGHWVIEPPGKRGGEHEPPERIELWRAWCRALKTTDLRFRFPFMDGFAIDRELLGGANA